MTQPAFVTLKEAAEMIGVHVDTLRRNMANYVRSGFPERDKVVNRYSRAAVQAFIESRDGTSATVRESQSQGVNTDALS